MRNAILLISLAAASLAAQTVPAASPALMLFTDAANGASFRYPAPWTLAKDPPFSIPLSTSASADGSSKNPLRAIVFTKSLPGLPSWPKTPFAGVEIGYDAPPAPSADACRTLANLGNEQNAKIGRLNLQGISYWHTKRASAGLGHGMEEDIYTTFLAAPPGVCLRFDLAVHTVHVDGDVPLRALTPRELALIHASLLGVLNSVRIPAPPR